MKYKILGRHMIYLVQYFLLSAGTVHINCQWLFIFVLDGKVWEKKISFPII